MDIKKEFKIDITKEDLDEYQISVMYTDLLLNSKSTTTLMYLNRYSIDEQLLEKIGISERRYGGNEPLYKKIRESMSIKDAEDWNNELMK